MRTILFKNLDKTLRDDALAAITRVNHTHNFIPLYSLAAIEKAIEDEEYDPDRDFVFMVKKDGHIKIESRYVAFL